MLNVVNDFISISILYHSSISISEYLELIGFLQADFQEGKKPKGALEIGFFCGGGSTTGLKRGQEPSNPPIF